MHPTEFHSKYNLLKAEVDRKLIAKSKEYSTAEDKFHNFKRAAAMEACTPEKALRGMMTKHTVSIYDLVDDVENNRLRLSLDIIEEKITDEIAYLYLLAGLFEERLGKDE